MAGDRDAEVDPRFDPVFQRGYDPTVHGARRPRTAPRHGTAPVPMESFRPPPAAAAPAPSEVATPTLAPAPAAPATPEPEAELEQRARNPFRLALLVTSIAAIVGAAALLWNRLSDDPYLGAFGSSDVGVLFRTQFVESSISPLLMGGLLGLALWLAIGAMRPRAADHG